VSLEGAGGVDWHALIYHASNEGLLGFLYHYARSQAISVPPWAEALLHQEYRHTAFQNLCLLRFVEEMGEALRQRDLPVMVLKGVSLLNTAYRDVGLRPMEDIDLLLRPRDLDPFKAILGDMGFAQDRVYQTTFNRGTVMVDLHTDLVSAHRIKSRKALLKLDPETLWRGALPFFDETVPVYRLAPYDGLIALAFHLLKHGFCRLIWFVDIQETLKAWGPDLEWMPFVDYCTRAGAGRCVLYALLLTRRLLGLPVPEEALQGLGQGKLSFLEKVLLGMRAANEPMGRLSQLLYLFQIKGALQRVRFIRENMFPRKEVMGQIFPGRHHQPLPSLYASRVRDLFLSAGTDLRLGARAMIKDAGLRHWK